MSNRHKTAQLGSIQRNAMRRITETKFNFDIGGFSISGRMVGDQNEAEIYGDSLKEGDMEFDISKIRNTEEEAIYLGLLSVVSEIVKRLKENHK